MRLNLSKFIPKACLPFKPAETAAFDERAVRGGVHGALMPDQIQSVPYPPTLSKASEELESRRLNEAFQNPNADKRPARPGIDIITEFNNSVHNSSAVGAKIARRLNLEFWSRGDFSDGATIDHLRRVKKYVRRDARTYAAADVALSKVAGVKRAEPPSLLERHANPFGRHYESMVAEKLVVNTTREAIRAAQQHAAFQREYLTKAFLSITPENQASFLSNLAYDLRKDTRPWSMHTPQLQNFVVEPNRENFAQLLRDPSSGYDMVAGQFVSVKSALLLRDWNAPPPWLERADANYRLVINPSRSTVARSKADIPETTRFGTSLDDQPRFSEMSGAQQSFSWADAKKPNFEKLRRAQESGVPNFEVNALMHGHAVVNGASGSANILVNMNQHIKKVDPDFNEGAATLNTLAFLTYDGGHSFNEAMGVHHMLTQGGDMPTRLDNLQAYRLAYNSLPGLLKDPYSADLVKAQMEESSLATSKHFAKHGFARKSFDGTTHVGQFDVSA